MDFILPLSGVLIGGIKTWWAARHHYFKASRDLCPEAADLKKLNILMLRGLEEAGTAEFSRDEEGGIQGVKIKVSSNIKAASATMKGDASVTPKNV